MNGMFADATSYNQAMDNWNVSQARKKALLPFFDVALGQGGMHGMFRGASSFNQSINNWNVEDVVDIAEMFLDAQSCQQDLCAWGRRLNFGADVSMTFSNTSCPYQMIRILALTRLVHFAIPASNIELTYNYIYVCVKMR